MLFWNLSHMRGKLTEEPLATHSLSIVVCTHTAGRRLSSARYMFLAHRIRISRSYLTHVILPRLSSDGCTLVILLFMHMVFK